MIHSTYFDKIHRKMHHTPNEYSWDFILKETFHEPNYCGLLETASVYSFDNLLCNDVIVTNEGLARMPFYYKTM